MLFYRILFLFPILGKCNNEFGIHSTLTNDEISALPIPDVAPYESDKSDPLSKLPETKKIYIQSLFSKSIYYPQCEKPPKPIIKVIYFWPGKRVDLVCRMCLRPFVYNGMVKHWSVLRNGVADALSNLKDSLNEWEVIDQQYSDTFATSGLPSMPTQSETFRPKTQFFQRDGKLIILHPHMNSFGLYRCFDTEGYEIVNFVYFLIPITPFFNMFKWNVHLDQCKPPKPQFQQFDEFHQFKFLPAILPKNDICSVFALQSNSTSDDYCSVNTFNVIISPPLNNIFNVSSHDKMLEESDRKILAKGINLKIFISWDQWSSCEQGESMKTRSGFCHIGKADPSKPHTTDELIFKQIHAYLEKVEEFKENGIRLFSGLMADILSPEHQIHDLSHCDGSATNSRQQWAKFNDAFIEMIKDSTKNTVPASIKEEMKAREGDLDIFDSVCLRSIRGKGRSENVGKVEYGQKIIQNEPCS